MERGDRYVNRLLKFVLGTSLVAQWLRLHASTAGAVGLTPGWGTKIPHAMLLLLLSHFSHVRLCATP